MEFRLIPKDLKMKSLKILLRKLGHPSGRRDNVFFGERKNNLTKSQSVGKKNTMLKSTFHVSRELTEW